MKFNHITFKKTSMRLKSHMETSYIIQYLICTCNYNRGRLTNNVDCTNKCKHKSCLPRNFETCSLKCSLSYNNFTHIGWLCRAHRKCSWLPPEFSGQPDTHPKKKNVNNFHNRWNRVNSEAYKNLVDMDNLTNLCKHIVVLSTFCIKQQIVTFKFKIGVDA